jgi:hypothetical protein
MQIRMNGLTLILGMNNLVRFFTDRIRVLLFGVTIVILGMINPSKTLQSVHDVLDRWV